MNNYKKTRIFTYVTLIAILMITGLFKVSTVKADSVDTVISMAPEGLPLDGFFSIPSNYNANTSGATTANSSKIITGPNALYPNTDAVKVTNADAKNEVGSAWGNLDSGNYLDVTKPQTLSMWLFFGQPDNNGDAADGMAFVLQNDIRGASAIATDSKNNPTAGETMGVWGNDIGTGDTSTGAVAKHAIQSSWALEFDTYSNKGSSKGTAFDSGTDQSGGKLTNGQHIAADYPGFADAYAKVSSGVYSMKHTQEGTLKPHNNVALAESSSMSGKGRWHHLTLEYTPSIDGASPYIDYYFNDKKIDGTAGHELGYDEETDHVTIDLSKFNLGTSNKLRYGFTGSTGDVQNTNMVIFETMPSLVNAETTSSINDVTQANREIASGGTVHAGDKLQFNYKLSYLSGSKSLDNANATITLPDTEAIDYTADSNGNVGNVNYTNADGIDNSVDIPKSAISDGTLNLTSLKSIGGEDGITGLTVQLNGKANDYGTSTHDVASEHAKFTSDYYKGDTMSPNFTIANPTTTKTLTLASDSLDKTAYIGSGDEVNLDGTMKYNTTDKVNNENIIFMVSVDGETPTNVAMSGGTNGEFTLPYTTGSTNDLSNMQLGKGKHTIEVFAVDKSNDYTSSNTLTYTVDVKEVGLIATADQTDITATDNSPIKLSGTYKHNNGMALEDPAVTVSYTINGGTTKTEKINNANGTFSLNIDPSDLNTGDNTVSVYLTDSALHTSEDNPLTYNINVPKTAPVLSTDNTDITALQSDGKTNLPGSVTYDGTYKFNDSDLTWHMSVAGADKGSSDIQSSHEDVTSSDFTQTFNLSDVGLNTVSDTPYVVTAYVTDPYGRQSNTVTYNVKVIDRTVSVNPDPTLSFNTINTSEADRVVKRSGGWNIMVHSVKSSWDLTANSSEFTKTVNNETTKLGANLIFTNKDGVSQSMMDQPILLDSNDDQDSEDVNVAGDWSADTGILLNVLPNPSAGKYNGTITWNITQGPVE
ncbi:hypothetical protein M5C72_03830 [Companilactobacillus allii]|uniref:WxL domain-containing protein n=1 Tax=Companilactobacillus allii TaxID=1847728 RepID=A0A1P8Q393_9LACO|nr:hypothetical protein [Companilactobacillus allii]APX72279.1 hypothetical protein BTM29_06770 [Companilactobacillus allii]USQ69371.1 hypothetical protein M5C72_03830 [Companilactobacillus allii]